MHNCSAKVKPRAIDLPQTQSAMTQAAGKSDLPDSHGGSTEEEIPGLFDGRAKLLLTAAAAVGLAGFSFAGGLFHIPAYHGFSASLLQQPNSPLCIALVAILFIAVVLISSIIAGS